MPLGLARLLSVSSVVAAIAFAIVHALADGLSATVLSIGFSGGSRPALVSVLIASMAMVAVAMVVTVAVVRSLVIDDFRHGRSRNSHRSRCNTRR